MFGSCGKQHLRWKRKCLLVLGSKFPKINYLVANWCCDGEIRNPGSYGRRKCYKKLINHDLR